MSNNKSVKMCSDHTVLQYCLSLVKVMVSLLWFCVAVCPEVTIRNSIVKGETARLAH